MVASLAEATDGDPAAKLARKLLRDVHDEIASLSSVAETPTERRALRLFLAHLAAGFAPAFRGTA